MIKDKQDKKQPEEKDAGGNLFFVKPVSPSFFTTEWTEEKAKRHSGGKMQLFL